MGMKDWLVVAILLLLSPVRNCFTRFPFLPYTATIPTHTIARLATSSEFFHDCYNWRHDDSATAAAEKRYKHTRALHSFLNKVPPLQAQRVPSSIADTMSFGNKMEINIKLPTRDSVLALEYLKNPKAIVEATWDRSKCRQLNDKTFLLIMHTLPLPGVDSITPEIEVDFVYDHAVKAVRMSSGNWTLRGTSGGVVKDSRFMQTFEISIVGQLSLMSNSETGGGGGGGGTVAGLPGQVSAIGWVEYRVQGEKPNIFKVAPQFVLEATIALIKESVSDFAEKQFTQVWYGMVWYGMVCVVN